MDTIERTQCSKTSRHVLLLCSVFGLVMLFGSPQPSYCQAPPNDNFDSAQAITSLPFTAQVAAGSASTQENEPFPCGYAPAATVWYSLTTPADMQVVVGTNGSTTPDALLQVYIGSSLESLSRVVCAWNGTVTLAAQAGQTYYIQMGTSAALGTLQLNVNGPPDNDNFINALQIDAIPFSQTEDITPATSELGEPQPACVPYPLDATVWYAFTPGEDVQISADATAWVAFIAVYSGTDPANLVQVGCRAAYAGTVTFMATAGVTYYFQVGNVYPWQRGEVTSQVIPTPPPSADFYWAPGMPSAFDTVQFMNMSFDPAGMGFDSWAWDFGDGATSAESTPSHKFAADGDYTVTLAVSTHDGRTASVSHDISVRTHDDAITRFTTPSAASSGQTREITVGVNSKRYPEYVTVQLIKSLPGWGDQVIGTLRQSVPVRSANRTTNFSFSYTFTKDDAAIGKAVFKATATLDGTISDALPGDNAATAFPTKVGR